MLIRVYYLIERKGCIHVEGQVVNGNKLEKAMDGIEKRLGKEPGFCFRPNKKDQIAILKEYMRTAFVDPLPNCWNFRRAFIEEQSA